VIATEIVVDRSAMGDAVDVMTTTSQSREAPERKEVGLVV